MHDEGKPFLALTAEDVMSRDVVTIREEMPLPEAARLLSRNQINGAPVVDAAGRCIGVLSATDFLHWAEEGGRDAEDDPMPTCRYQVKGRLLTGEAAVICTLAPGACPLQAIRPTTAGGHTAVCMQPSGALCDWQLGPESRPDSVRRHMTADVVTVGPQTPLSELARTMIDGHIHRVIVTDAMGRPIGIVSSTDVIAAVARTEPAAATL